MLYFAFNYYFLQQVMSPETHLQLQLHSRATHPLLSLDELIFLLVVFKANIPISCIHMHSIPSTSHSQYKKRHPIPADVRNAAAYSRRQTCRPSGLDLARPISKAMSILLSQYEKGSLHHLCKSLLSQNSKSIPSIRWNPRALLFLRFFFHSILQN